MIKPHVRLFRWELPCIDSVGEIDPLMLIEKPALRLSMLLRQMVVVVKAA